MKVLNPLYRAMLCGLLIAVSGLVACGDGNGEDDFSPKPTELKEIVAADTAHFEAQWKDDVKVVDQALVYQELQNLTPPDNIFHVQKGSPLIADTAVGDIVVWPGQGVFRILDLSETSNRVAIEVEWADLAEAAHTFEASFQHNLSADSPGRAFGVGPAGPTPDPNRAGYIVQPITAEAGPFTFTEDGAAYKGDTVNATFQAMNNTIRTQFVGKSPGVTATVKGTLSGLSAAGKFSLKDGDAEPDVLIQFNNLELKVEASLEIDNASGSTEIIPPAQIVFPFMVGPLPMYISIGSRIEIKSTAMAEAKISTSASFTANGSLTLRRTAEGQMIVDGDIHSFNTQRPSMSAESVFTLGATINFDAPRIAFGVGRPNLVSAEIYGTNSVELVANLVIEPFNDNATCAKVGTGAAVLYGGLIDFFGFKINSEAQAAYAAGVSEQRGSACK